MGRMYTVQFSAVTVSAVQDFFEIVPASNKPVAVWGLFLAQYSDLGDAAEEIIRYQVIRGHATSGSAGATPTPVPLDEFDSAAGFTAETNNTTQASTGTTVVLHTGAFNIRAGEQLWLPPEARWRCTAAQNRLVVRLSAAPADGLDMVGTLYVEEV